MLERKSGCLTFDLQHQVRFEVGAHQTIWSEVPQLVVFASLRGNRQAAAGHHHTACGLQATVLQQLEMGGEGGGGERQSVCYRSTRNQVRALLVWDTTLKSTRSLDRSPPTPHPESTSVLVGWFLVR